MTQEAKDRLYNDLRETLRIRIEDVLAQQGINLAQKGINLDEIRQNPNARGITLALDYDKETITTLPQPISEFAQSLYSSCPVQVRSIEFNYGRATSYRGERTIYSGGFDIRTIFITIDFINKDTVTKVNTPIFDSYIYVPYREYYIANKIVIDADSTPSMCWVMGLLPNQELTRSAVKAVCKIDCGHTNPELLSELALAIPEDSNNPYLLQPRVTINPKT